MNKMINLVIIIGLCLEIFIYMIMFIKVIYLNFIIKYKYVPIANTLDKISLLICLVTLMGNLKVVIDGNKNSFLGVIMMGALCYSLLSKILCFESDEKIFIQGSMLLKSKTHITNKEYGNKSNIVSLKSEKTSINIWVSNKGKEALYARFGDSVIHNEKDM